MKKPSIKTCRRFLQVFIALAFVIIPYLNSYRINLFRGNFLCFHAAGLPLADPLAVLQVSVKNWYLSPKLLIGAGIVLSIAFALGTVFCSWICPYGLLSELVHGLSKKLLPKKFKGFVTKRKGFPIKIIIFGLGFLGFLLFSTTPVLNQLSMPAWYSRIFQFIFVQHHISLAILFVFSVLLVEFFARNRIWCRYVCPQAVLLVLAKLLNSRRLRVVYDKNKCIIKKGKSPCERACTLSLDPKTLNPSLETECTNCGDCIVACKKMGQALEYRFGLSTE